MQKYRDLALQCKECEHLHTIGSRIPFEDSQMDCIIRHNITLEKAKIEVCPYRSMTRDAARALLFDLAKGLL